MQATTDTLKRSLTLELVDEPRLTGRVKWFNNKSGFGFITVCDGGHKDKEIFIHYSSIRTESSKYKYLVQGEYVEFLLVKSGNDNHEYHASDISGIKEGILMCETHCLNAVKLSQNYESVRQSDDATGATGRDTGAQVKRSYNGGFTEVKRRQRVQV